MSGNFSAQSFDGLIGGFDVDGVYPASNWRDWDEWRGWRRDEPDIRKGDLPEELRKEADKAIESVVQAPRLIESDGKAALLQAMEARQAYDEAYRKAYQDAYVAEIVALLWLEDVRKAKYRRNAALLLLLS